MIGFRGRSGHKHGFEIKVLMNYREHFRLDLELPREIMQTAEHKQVGWSPSSCFTRGRE